jgi:hypothetical protein
MREVPRQRRAIVHLPHRSEGKDWSSISTLRKVEVERRQASPRHPFGGSFFGDGSAFSAGGVFRL